AAPQQEARAQQPRTAPSFRSQQPARAPQPRTAPPPVEMPAPRAATGDSFEEKLRAFMKDSESKMSSMKNPPEKKQRRMRTK
ncbi:MAG: hypothetical protein IKU55_05630, partial [Clostridia bacterium]|nr:hypothetical protein [Clostridia bacterium]